ncbi:phage tail assembly chaperone [Sphingopyxis sp.]|uniref:phage tail assembly chaperone n=1 Tax=Sphingopyxis sp. TaxID=1908224 RepID=UPI003D0A20DA
MTEEGFGSAALVLAGVTARVLGWRPDDFWMATPADVAAVLAAWREGRGDGGLDRMGLAAMMEQFPDG